MNEIIDEAEQTKQKRDPILDIADKMHAKLEKGRELDKRYNSFAGC